MEHKESNPVAAGFLRFSIGILFFLEASVALLYYFLDIPEEIFIFVSVVMGVTSILSLALVYSAFHWGWISNIRSLRMLIFGGYSFSMLIVVAVIAIITRTVFNSIHDVLLTGTLLFFGSGIFMSFGYILTNSFTRRISELMEASREITRGNLAKRVAIQGRDELAELGESFNVMAGKLQELDNQHKEQQRMRTDMLVSLGHDLRTPLTSIRAMIEAISDKVVDDPATVHRYIEKTRREISYLSRLIDDLFDLSKIDAEGLRPDRHDVSLPDLISDTLESFSEIAHQKSIQLTGNVQPGIDLVNVDAQLINRVLANLTSNAISFTPKHGKVNIQASRQDEKVWVTVCDNGEGIKDEDMPFIFERFYRAEKSRNRRTGGTGLGLAICKGIMDAHGETIIAQSREGKGTCFSFSLPESLASRSLVHKIRDINLTGVN